MLCRSVCVGVCACTLLCLCVCIFVCVYVCLFTVKEIRFDLCERDGERERACLVRLCVSLVYL